MKDQVLAAIEGRTFLNKQVAGLLRVLRLNEYFEDVQDATVRLESYTVDGDILRLNTEVDHGGQNYWKAYYEAPLEFLWLPQEQVVEAVSKVVAERKAKAEETRLAKVRQTAAETESRERDMLKTLKEKYGSPE
jgi:hypothetical protein